MAALPRIDRRTLRSLIVHEARIQVTPGRELRDLGDALLLVDLRDAEPYWNRLMAPEWPAGPAEFDRRLDAAITLFSTFGRLPHIWPYPGPSDPPDLVERLLAAGFERMGSDQLMVLVDPGPSAARLAAARLDAERPPRVTVERLRGLSPASLRAVTEVAAVLAAAFGVGADRRISIELETLAALDSSALEVCLVRLDGQAAAVAKRTTAGGMTYLSSIGTVPAFRGRGLGALVTAAVTSDAVTAGSSMTYLKVDTQNWVGQRLYRSLGFAAVPGEVHDLLLGR